MCAAPRRGFCTRWRFNAEVSGLSAEEVYGVIASVEAEVRLSMFAAMKQAQQKGTL